MLSGNRAVGSRAFSVARVRQIYASLTRNQVGTLEAAAGKRPTARPTKRPAGAAGDAPEHTEAACAGSRGGKRTSRRA